MDIREKSKQIVHEIHREETAHLKFSSKSNLTVYSQTEGNFEMFWRNWQVLPTELIISNDSDQSCANWSAPTTSILFRLLLVHFRLRQNGNHQFRPKSESSRVVVVWVVVVRSHPKSYGVAWSRLAPEQSRVDRNCRKSSEVVGSRPEASGVVRSRPEPESFGLVQNRSESTGIVVVRYRLESSGARDLSIQGFFGSPTADDSRRLRTTPNDSERLRANSDGSRRFRTTTDHAERTYLPVGNITY